MREIPSANEDLSEHPTTTCNSAGCHQEPGESVGAAAEGAVTAGSAVAIGADWPLVVDGLAEGVIATDAGNRIVYVNAAAERILGSSHQELIDRPLADLVPERFRARHVEGFRRYVDTGASSLIGVPIRLPALRRDGSEIVVELVISAGNTAVGVAAIGLLREVSDRVELEGPSDLSDRLVAILAEASTLDDAWPRVLEALVETLGWQVAQLWLRGGPDEPLQRRAAWPRRDGAYGAFLTASGRTFRRGIGLPGRVWETLAPVWMPQLATEEDFVRAKEARDAGLHSGFAFPLVAGGRLLGVIELLSTVRRDRDSALTERLWGLGRELGWFLERRSSEEQQLALATTLQQSLLPPSLPTIPGVALAARYLPAGGGTDVGGDFYDVFRVSRNAWGVVIGDVCGRGAAAAAVTALARYTIRASAMQFRSPARVFEALNDVMLREAEEGFDKFVTSVFARLTVIDGLVHLTFASGGHPLPLIRRATGQVEEVGRPGTLLGVVERPSFHDSKAVLEPGDLFVMVTDGVLEARRDGEQFGDARLAEVLHATTGASANETVNSIVHAVASHERGQHNDDLALIAVAATAPR